jgi:hypothetical protein
LLVVMAVIEQFAIAMVSINGLPGSREGLRFEAERLAQLLYLARRGGAGPPVPRSASRPTIAGSVSRSSSGDRWQPVMDDRDLRERPCEGATTLRVSASRRPAGGGVRTQRS